MVQEAHHGDGIVTAAELDAWSAAAFDRAPTPMLQVARAGALFRLGRWDEAETLLGPWAEAAAGRAGMQAKQLAARLRIARARAELAALKSGVVQRDTRFPSFRLKTAGHPERALPGRCSWPTTPQMP